MAKEPKTKSGISSFQRTLLENLIRDDEVLRHGSSEPVQDLIKRGYIEKKTDKKGATTFVATKEAKAALK